MTRDESKKQTLIPPKPLLKKLSWMQEYKRGADESVDDPPLFGSSGADLEFDESMSVDFGWPMLSSDGPSMSDPQREGTPLSAPDSALPAQLTNVGEAHPGSTGMDQLKDLAYVPSLLVEEPDLVWQRLNHREGYVLSQIDGKTSFADILEIAGLSDEETKRILLRLLQSGVIG